MSSEITFRKYLVKETQVVVLTMVPNILIYKIYHTPSRLTAAWNTLELTTFWKSWLEK